MNRMYRPQHIENKRLSSIVESDPHQTVNDMTEQLRLRYSTVSSYVHLVNPKSWISVFLKSWLNKTWNFDWKFAYFDTLWTEKLRILANLWPFMKSASFALIVIDKYRCDCDSTAESNFSAEENSDDCLVDYRYLYPHFGFKNGENINAETYCT